MLHTDYRTMLDRGRKAGLNTRELYLALAARHPAPGDLPTGQSDGNGFVVRLSTDGHREIHPASERK